MLEIETQEPAQNSSMQLLTVALGMLLVGAVGGFFLGKVTTAHNATESTKAEVASVEASSLEKLQNTEKKLSYCYANRAESSPITTEPYAFDTFGIYSPLLEGTTVEVTEYTYKEETIIMKTAEITNDDGSTNTVEVWIASASGDYISPEYSNFPTFGGYENVGNPIYISEIIEKWDTEVYKSKFGNEFHYSYYYAPEGVTSVILDFAATYSPLGKPIFVRIYQPIESDQYPKAYELDKPEVTVAKAKLKVIAETFEVKL